MGDYRLEACAICRTVRLALNTWAKERRRDRVEYASPSNTPIYIVDFCESCKKAYDEHSEALAGEAAAAEERTE